VSRFCKTLETTYHIPTVGCAAANVMKYAVGYNISNVTGMPVRFVGFPFPVAGQPQEVHRRYVRGNDMLSGKPMMQTVIDYLTKPRTEEEKYTGPAPAPTPEPRFLPADTEENLRRFFKEKDWTDYNPIILPTGEKVNAMLEGTSRQPDEVVVVLTWPGGERKFTVEKAAICAVMAGARPEYFPLILALGTQVGSFGNSTSSMANIILVNGPIRNELGMNYKGNAMGPHNEVNSVLGRVFTIMAKTAGNIHHGVTTFSTLGSNLQYNNLCIAENEEALPEGWKPYHVRMRFKPNDSTVTVGRGWTYISGVGEAQKAYPPHLLMRDYMRSLAAIGGGTVIMDPTVAALLKDNYGMETKDDLSKWLADNVEKTVDSFFGNGVAATMYIPMAMQGLKPFADYLEMPGDTLIKPLSARGINILAVGGEIQTTWFVTDFSLGRPVSVDEWR
jgi:hypothetical protein